MITNIEMTYRHLDKIALTKLGPTNIVVGPNNSGKTSIFRGVQASGSGIEFRLGTEIAKNLDLASQLLLAWPGAPEGLVYWTWGSESFFCGSSSIGKCYRIKGRHVELREQNSHDWNRIVQVSEARDVARNSVLALLNELRSVHKAFREESYFLWHRRKSQYREILGAYHDRLDNEAQSLAGRLNQVLSSTSGRRIHEEINGFMNEVIPKLGEVGIKHSKANDERTLIEVVFRNQGVERTLEELGGGVEQVLALCLVLLGEKDEGAVFIEEPESHLHEGAQRRLIEQIVRHQGKRQLFLATHSATFVNEYPGANVYQVNRDGTGNASVRPCLDRPEQRQVLDQLGVLPSSLTQTNCVVWVEGPTESRLVRYLLGLIAPDLRLHRHYEFAETGGSNIVQIAADTTSGSDEGALRDIFRICRHNFFVCDRDAGVGSPPSKEFVKGIGGLVNDKYWVTRGYEIEWYYPDSLIRALWGENAASHMMLCAKKDEPFFARLAAIAGATTAGRRKVLFAERAIKEIPDPQDWFAGDMGRDLRENLERLAAFIRDANQMPRLESEESAKG